MYGRHLATKAANSGMLYVGWLSGMQTFVMQELRKGGFGTRFFGCLYFRHAPLCTGDIRQAQGLLPLLLASIGVAPLTLPPLMAACHADGLLLGLHF